MTKKNQILKDNRSQKTTNFNKKNLKNNKFLKISNFKKQQIWKNR